MSWSFPHWRQKLKKEAPPKAYALRGGRGAYAAIPSFVVGILLGLCYHEVLLRETALRLLDLLELGDPAHALLRQVARDPSVVLNAKVGANADGIRALVTSQDLAQGDTILKLPLSWVLTRQTLPASMQRLVQRCFKAKKPCEDTSLLALALLASMREGWRSRFRHYIKSLPPLIRHVLKFSPAQVSMGEARIALQQLKQQIRATEQLVKGYPDALSPPPTNEDIVWATSIVATRSFHIALEDSLEYSKFNSQLIPVMDLANHHPDPSMTSFVGGQVNDALIWTAVRPLKRGEEIYSWYGPKSNMELLLMHGFAHPENLWGPRLRLQPVLPTHAVWELQRIGCKPEHLPDHGHFASTHLRLNRPLKSPDDAIDLPAVDLRCVRIAEAIVRAPEHVHLALKDGYFEGDPHPAGRPEIVEADRETLRKVRERCKELAERYDGDDQWISTMQAQSEGRASGASSELNELSGLLLKAFLSNRAAVKGCVRSAESMARKLMIPADGVT